MAFRIAFLGQQLPDALPGHTKPFGELGQVVVPLRAENGPKPFAGCHEWTVYHHRLATR